MADTRFCERCQKDVPRFGLHPCVKALKPAEIAPKPKTAKKPALHAERERPSARPEKLTSTVEAKKTAKTTPNKARKAKALPIKETPLPITALPIAEPLPIKEASAKAAKSGAQRQKEWRGRNRAGYNEYMRGYLKGRRSKSTEAQGRP